MNVEELLEACDDAVERGIGLTLVGPRLHGFRPELLCVNSKGEQVHRYSTRQCRKLAKRIRHELEIQQEDKP